MVESAVVETSAWKDIALLLLGATADHAVHCGPSHVEQYRKQLRESIGVLQEAGGSAQILMNAGGVVQAISHYSDQTQTQVDALLTDIKGTAEIFLSHLERLHADVESQPILAALRTTMEQALAEGKLGAARDAALASLDELGRHATDRRAQSLELTGNLQDRITILQQSVPQGATPAPTASATVDSTTGLPKRTDAEEAIHQALDTVSDSGPRFYAAIFYLHRIPLTNARFGEAIGNQVVLFCSQHIATTVTGANDLLFRWSGPAFVAILERQEAPLAVSGEVQRLISSPISRFFETSSRSVYLPVKVTAQVIPLFETNFAEVSSKLEHFVLTTSGQAAAN